ncbi:MAG: glycogen synthase [Synergistales bacterium]|nr:glycogen synthase [Synergistales bacterium]
MDSNESSTGQKLKVLHVSPEMAPLSKVGGLADVADSLPRALRYAGVDARVVTPAYGGVLDRVHDLGWNLSDTRKMLRIAMNWEVFTARIWKASSGDHVIYLLEQEELFSDKSIYRENLDLKGLLPFAFLSLAALELTRTLPFSPDVIHLHDWGTSLTSTAMKWHPYFSGFAGKFKTVFTIHNLAHQGLIPPDFLQPLGLHKAFHINGLEFYGMANLVKGAIIDSDAITTVSPTYSHEIQSPDAGMGLDGLIRSHSWKLRGILNGLDMDYWDPSTDPALEINFDSSSLSLRKDFQDTFIGESGLDDSPGPLIGSVGRLYLQKGMDIMIPAIRPLIHEGFRFIFLGSGDPYFEGELMQLSREFPGRIRVTLGYDESLAHKIYGSSDMFIMPSLFEPCGLSQLIALRYGAVPIVRETGGLSDTIVDVHGDPEGYGYLFHDYSSHAIIQTCLRALADFHDPSKWENIVLKGMKKDFSWNNSAMEYVKLYRHITGLAGHETG